MLSCWTAGHNQDACSKRCAQTSKGILQHRVPPATRPRPHAPVKQTLFPFFISDFRNEIERLDKEDGERAAFAVNEKRSSTCSGRGTGRQTYLFATFNRREGPGCDRCSTADRRDCGPSCCYSTGKHLVFELKK